MLMNFCNSKECITLKLLKVDESTWINPDNMVKYSTNFLNSWADECGCGGVSIEYTK